MVGETSALSCCTRLDGSSMPHSRMNYPLHSPARHALTAGQWALRTFRSFHRYLITYHVSLCRRVHRASGRPVSLSVLATFILSVLSTSTFTFLDLDDLSHSFPAGHDEVILSISH